MASLKIINGKNKYRNEDAKEKTIAYILRKDRIINGYCSGVMVSQENPAKSMKETSEYYGKSKGVQLRHYVLGFENGECSDASKANDIGMSISEQIGKEYQTVYAVHENTDNLHIHFITNSVSYIDGHRCQGSRKEYYMLRSEMKNVLRHYEINELRYVK